MKNFKKFAISLALTFMIALCPILCMACCGTTDTNGKNIAKALGDAIAIIENHNAENTDVEENSLTTSAMDVEFLPLGQDVQVNVIQLDYIKEIAASSKFKYTKERQL